MLSTRLLAAATAAFWLELLTAAPHAAATASGTTLATSAAAEAAIQPDAIIRSALPSPSPALPLALPLVLLDSRATAATVRSVPNQLRTTSSKGVITRQGLMVSNRGCQRATSCCSHRSNAWEAEHHHQDNQNNRRNNNSGETEAEMAGH